MSFSLTRLLRSWLTTLRSAQPVPCWSDYLRQTGKQTR